MLVKYTVVVALLVSAARCAAASQDIDNTFKVLKTDQFLERFDQND